MPGELTATERRVLDLLGEGLHDAEIAVRLGLTVGDLKQRITAILQRQRLVDREALLAWHRGEQTAAPSLAPNDTPRDRRRWYIGAGVSAGIVALFSLLFLLPGGDRSPASAEPTPPTATPTPAGPPPGFVLRDAVPLDPGYALTVLAYELNSDGVLTGIAGFDRIYIDPADGLTVLREPVWRIPDGAEFDANWTINNEGTRIAALYVDADGQRWMEVQLASGRFSDPIALRRSEFPFMFAGARVVVRDQQGSWAYMDPGNPDTRFEIRRPDGTDNTPVGWSPDTGIVWAEYGTPGSLSGDLVASRGTVPQLSMGHGDLIPGNFQSFVPLDAARAYLSFEDVALVSWHADQLASGVRLEGLFTSIVRLATGERLATYRGEFWPAGIANDGRFTGTYCDDGCRLAFMANRGPEVTPIDGLPSTGDVPLVLASTQRGPVARVRDLDGHCAPLMDGLPPFRRDVVDCVTTGTLLTLADVGDGIGNGAPPHLEAYDGTTFVGVLTLDGAPAWVERAHVDVDLAGPD